MSLLSYSELCWRHALTFILLIIAAAAAPAMAADHMSVDELLTMKIEDLVNVKVTTLSKREQKYMSTAGAVFVISSDDIRRSGARSIPEALRLAPGLQVSQSNMNEYQIGIRGQTDFFTDLLLVMVDGRPIYTTTFSGVWWVTQNYPLEDIDRIEIVRGPGGAIWGSNAVNGVINIKTKKAGGKPGLRISGGGGTEDRGFGNISYSSSIGNADYRVYAMKETRDGGLTPLVSHKTSWGYLPNRDMPDSRQVNQQGFRLDWGTDAVTKISLHGDAYQVHAGSSMYWMPTVVVNNLAEYTHKNSYSGKNLVFHMEKEVAHGVLFKGQLFFDQYKLHRQMMREEKNTYDADMQFDFAGVMGQDISVGSNVRFMRSRNDNTPQFSLPNRTTHLASFFINDEVRFLDDLLRINGGVKVERNSFTSWESQPSVRAIVGDDRWAVWTSASQAVRTPNDMENGLRWALRSTGGKILKQVGDGRAKSERVTSYEMGARLRPTEESLVEVTTFRIFYKGVLDTWQDRSATNPYVLAGVIPEYLTNVLNGKADGVEANFRYKPWEWMTLKGSYTYLHQLYDDYPVKDNETKWTVLSVKAQDPANRFHLGAGLGPVRGFEFDANLYFTGPFREGDIHGYHRLDMRLGWRPVENLEISLVGQDMLQASYQSNTDSIIGYASSIQQRYYLSATYTYN
ncbi:MAG: TonB-dependent receptor [Zetaproteobacteria bacterium CG12_big_fil_rev_8_21_14_0_65_55_1124]|nr:MAG: TonB-dependent receptor [Zetaproteobacteria bacterium CG08_land_8_20_14_0_20_55_17]PIW42698.1 MAG: TonB-dependent receptor [Zetaproteobacteria bacterium CG12_big_fil_rev_8_21_14_0_65_55_1124]PIY53712.1 MAG: TonB-dependent receptor [Zetaproteobacteria bacterium CG_4_10_14_0_8_um_filter_55_43]PIZ38827.1 MAG: TonB-dependent receptor [Zetaproteobacteria bacterium CG_4_10_14_0_2_um_filter_55_20]PJB81453.1 MAG: TonB-dependent receptor [Zetaproteobacteria bacterium CG_4_9_14_0_8_um_filter_55_3